MSGDNDKTKENVTLNSSDPGVIASSKSDSANSVPERAMGDQFVLDEDAINNSQDEQIVTDGEARQKVKKASVIVAGAVVAFVLMGVLVFAGIQNGVFLSKADKLLAAVANTFMDHQFMQERTALLELLSSDKYTMEVVTNIDVDGDRLNARASIAKTPSKRQASYFVKNTDYPDLDIGCTAQIDRETLKLRIPFLVQETLVYHYAKGNQGYLIDCVEPNQMKEFNQLLQMCFLDQDTKKQGIKMLDSIYQRFCGLDIGAVSDREFQVDGENRQCKGYSFTITSDWFHGVLEDVEAYGENYQNSLELLGVDFKETINDAAQELKDMSDIGFEVYIYKNKLAAIIVEVNDEIAEMRYLGGSTRTQNMEFIVDDEKLMEWKGRSGDKDSVEIYLDGSKLLEMEYQQETKKFKAAIYSADEDNADVIAEGTMELSKEKVEAELESFILDNMELGISGTFSLSNDARIEELPGEEFDIGNAIEAEWEELIERNGNYLGSFIGM